MERERERERVREKKYITNRENDRGIERQMYKITYV